MRAQPSRVLWALGWVAEPPSGRSGQAVSPGRQPQAPCLCSCVFACLTRTRRRIAYRLLLLVFVVLINLLWRAMMMQRAKIDGKEIDRSRGRCSLGDKKLAKASGALPGRDIHPNEGNTG